MRINTLIHLAAALAIGATIFILSSLSLGFDTDKATFETELFEPMPQECVPTIKGNEYKVSLPQMLQKNSTLNTPSADDIMNNLVRYTTLKPTNDTCPIISQYDAQILMAIGQAEAEVDGVEGMAAVIQVVLNRIKSDEFPSSIEQVVTQSRTLSDGRTIYQFSTVDIGTYFTTTPSVQAHLALAEVEKGNYQWLDALYFENAEDSWQAKHCEYICTIGHHKFYR